MLVLPAAIVPLLFLGPAMLRAPERVWLQARRELLGSGTGPRAAGVRPGSASLPSFPAQLAAPLGGAEPRPGAGAVSPTGAAARR